MTGVLLLLTALAGAGDDKLAVRVSTLDFARVDAAVLEGIRKGIYPGAVIVIGTSERILHAQRYGRFTWSQRSMRPRSDSTLWDLASLTKVIGTTGAVLRLVDRGEMELDAPVRRYLPGFSGGAKDRVTIRMLLDHTSGLRPYLPLFRTAASRDLAVTQVLADTLIRLPGDSAVYSDLNAILLGLAVEAAAGMPLDSVVQREVLQPLAMRQTMFRPRPSLWERTAPSSLFNRAPVTGLVNDRNAVVLGGVAGHAGLFGTGQDLARYAQAWLREGALADGGRWVRPETLREFLVPSRRAGSRLLGWDSPDPDPKDDVSVFGKLLSPLAYGHTGWTGTEIWIDPARDLFVVFLTNRSFDPRARNSLVALRDVRARVSDAAAALVPAQCTLARARARARARRSEPGDVLTRPVLLYDGKCAFCRGWVGRIERRDRDGRIELLPADDRARIPDLPLLSDAALDAAMHLVMPDGRVFSGGRAVPEILRLLPGGRVPALLFLVPGVPALVRAGYAWVARRRHRLGCRDGACGIGAG